MKRDDDVDVEKSDRDIATLRITAMSTTSVNKMKLSSDNDRKQKSAVPGDDEGSETADSEFKVLATSRSSSDGGWGWVVTGASFLSNMIVDGVCYTFGLLYAELLQEFDAGRSKTALVGSLLVGTYLMIGYTQFTRSSKRRASLIELRPWLKCRPRLIPQLFTCYIGLPITTRPPF